MFKLVTICGKEFTWWIILRANHENITYKSTLLLPYKTTKLLLLKTKPMSVCLHTSQTHLYRPLQTNLHPHRLTVYRLLNIGAPLIP